MTLLDYIFFGITLFIALVLADLTSSAIKWHIANYKIRQALESRKKRLQSFKDDMKKRLRLTGPPKDQ